MTRQALTGRQAAVLAYIRSCIKTNTVPPSSREIAAHFHFASPRAATGHLAALERKGYITRIPGSARNVRLADPAADGIPILGTVAAGAPIAAEQNYTGHLDFRHMFGNEAVFAVTVRGDSMTDFGILDGDTVIVRQQPLVRHGTIAVVYVCGETTVKRIEKTKAGYRLVPGNRKYQPVEITAATPDFQIAGPVVGVVRVIK